MSRCSESTLTRSRTTAEPTETSLHRWGHCLALSAQRERTVGKQSWIPRSSEHRVFQTSCPSSEKHGRFGKSSVGFWGKQQTHLQGPHSFGSSSIPSYQHQYQALHRPVCALSLLHVSATTTANDSPSAEPLPLRLNLWTASRRRGFEPDVKKTWVNTHSQRNAECPAETGSAGRSHSDTHLGEGLLVVVFELGGVDVELVLVRGERVVVLSLLGQELLDLHGHTFTAVLKGSDGDVRRCHGV